jgi:hypothetical protein
MEDEEQGTWGKLDAMPKKTSEERSPVERGVMRDPITGKLSGRLNRCDRCQEGEKEYLAFNNETGMWGSICKKCNDELKNSA